MSHRQELSTSPSYCCCCCEPEFDPVPLLIESRHDALDSSSTPCIRVPSPLAWGRNSDRELRAQRRLVLGDGDRGSILTASPVSCSSTIGVPACRLLVQRQQYELLLYKYLVPCTTWYVWSPCRTKKNEMLVFT